MRRSRRSSPQRLRDDPQSLIYGVTSAPGDAAGSGARPTGEGGATDSAVDRDVVWRGLPDRVVRAIVVARLANFLEGHAAVRGRPRRPSPTCSMPPSCPPWRGSPTAARARSWRWGPCSTGSVAAVADGQGADGVDQRLPVRRGPGGGRRVGGPPAIELADTVFALVAEISGAPDEHFAPELGELWGDEHEAAALRSLRTLLDGSDRVRQRHQSSVSVRILPRVLGGARRALAEPSVPRRSR